jgi:hypothetical protein
MAGNIRVSRMARNGLSAETYSASGLFGLCLRWGGPYGRETTTLETEEREALKQLRGTIRDIGSIVAQSVSAWLAHDASSMGAALAFYTLFSVAPILIIALASRSL